MNSAERAINPPRDVFAIRVSSTSTNASSSCSISTSTFASTSASTSISTPSISSTTEPLKLILNSTAKEIAHEWDILATFPGPFTSTKLAISSKILSTASPVFESILKPLSCQTSPVQIEFSDDDSQQALEAIFCVLHFRHECVSTKVSPDVLYEIAIVAIKYSLVRALGPWKEVWLKSGTGEGVKGLFVRHAFGDRKGFTEECRRVILQSLGYDGNNDRGNGKEEESEPKRERENRWDSNLDLKRIHELISEARISTINSLLTVSEHFTTLYYSKGIKCKVYVPSEAPIPPNCCAIPACDAGILGSLLSHYAKIGICPVPLPPYKGISVENLALALKGLRCTVKVGQGHGGCSIIGQVSRKVDEVLARVDRLDIWESIWGKDEAAGKGPRKGTGPKFLLLQERTMKQSQA